MRALLMALGAVAVWSACPVWFIYCIYNLFALSAPFWSTVGFSLLMLVVQFVVGWVAFVFGALK